MAWTCFHEDDPGLALPRRAGAEALGTCLLVLAASSGGMAAARAFAPLPGLVLPMMAVIIAGALVGLIVALGKVSGGHFNPLITLLQWLGRERTLTCTLAYVVAQILGGMLGGLLGAQLWGGGVAAPPAPAWSGFESELLASLGLMIVVFGCGRGQRGDIAPFAVGAWLIAAILAFPTTSFANPAVVLGALMAASPFGLSPGVVPGFLLAEGAGALIAFALIALIYPQPKE